MVEKVLHTVLYLRRTEMEFKKKKKRGVHSSKARWFAYVRRVKYRSHSPHSCPLNW